MQTIDVHWRKSSYSGNGGQDCVETASAPGAVLVRDTRDNGRGLVLRVTPDDWKRFSASIKG